MEMEIDCEHPFVISKGQELEIRRKELSKEDRGN